MPISVFLAVAIAIGGFGIWALLQFQDDVKREVLHDLGVVADLKLEHLNRWFGEHRRVAAMVTSDVALSRQVEIWVGQGAPRDARARALGDQLNALSQVYGFRTAVLLDAMAEPRITVGLDPSPLNQRESDLVRRALSQANITLAETGRGRAESGAEFGLGLALPLTVRRAGGVRAIAAVFLRLDTQSLFSVIADSQNQFLQSTETLFVRAAGDAMVYLMKLRHNATPILNLADLPTASSLLAAKAAQGMLGMVEGTDYRGVPVVGASRKSPDLPSLYLIVKVDRSEIDEPIARRATTTVAAILSILAVAAFTIFLWWSRQMAFHLIREHRIEVQRRTLARRFDFLTRYANDVIRLTDEAGRILEINDAASRIYGYTREELLTMNARDLRAPDTVDTWEADRSKWASGQLYESLHRRKDGSIFPVEISGSVVELEGRLFHQGIFRDISRRKRAEDQVRQYAKVFEFSRDAILITDVHRKIVAVNPAFTVITGYAEPDVVGDTPRRLSSGRHGRDFYDAMWAAIRASGFWEGEIWNKRRTGEVYPGWLSITAVKDEQGCVTHYAGTLSDLSERKAAEDRMSFMAYHDELTGLPNRALLHDRLERALATSERSGNQAALLYVDLDHFKLVNDSLGHHLGDRLLQEVAKRLVACVRSTDTVSRVGGDEFAVVLANVSEHADAAVVAQKMIVATSAPLDIDGHNLCVSPSIGIALYPKDAVDARTLFRHADVAMYHAKGQGRNNYQFFTADMNVRVSERLKIENDLRLALERGQIFVHYQPQVDCATGRIIGVEALVRWAHPEKGMIPPAAFIPIAEECGLIIPIGRHVLFTACAQCRAWQLSGLRPISVAVNVSAIQFHDRYFFDSISRALAETGLAPELLELELTESVVMTQAEGAVNLMQRLKALGVALSIDDFGTGFSSLSYLKRFPIHRLKIDRSFVSDMNSDSSSEQIVKSIIALGHSLGLRVIAEGVETEQQLAFLRSALCDEAQGYYLGRPAPGEELTRILAKT